MFKTVLVICLSLCFVAAKHEIYDGHALFQVNVKDVDQVKLVNQLESELNLDVWSHALPGRPGQVLVPRVLRQQFENALTAAAVQYNVEVENIKEMLELEDQLMAAAAKKSNASRASSVGLSFDEIHRYDVVDAYLEELANQYPDIVKVVSAGKSFEGRDIKYLKISTTDFKDPSKPVVMMQSLLHCREWVGLPATLYAIQKLVFDVSEQDLLENIDWIITPIANPDGYEYSHTTERFWRKNRATGYMIADICMGVDLNRNFDHNWSAESSFSACTDTFHGRAPFSEPETIIIRDIILENIDRLELFLDIHSFGSLILYGFGDGVLPPNGLDVHVAGVLMAQTIDQNKWAIHPNYVVGNVAMVLYKASGSAMDYAQAKGATLAYTLELPAYMNQSTLLGFLVDPEFIEQAGYETWEGIKAGAIYAAANYRARKGIK